MQYELLVPAFSALMGAVVGGLVTYFTTKAMERWKQNEERKVVFAAMVAEIEMITVHLDRRHYAEDMERIIEDYRKGRRSQLDYHVMIPEDYCPVYKSHLSRIGLLPYPLIGDIVRFYQILQSIVEDVRPGGPVAEGCSEGTMVECVAITREATRLGRDVVKKAKPLLARL
ncbi:MAG: hypothetical protein Q7P63_01185 [Verrucomicrobiota bacterium JB022]|nr:hypothetical protein [Verrucomicrobiota bacterium JB022]